MCILWPGVVGGGGGGGAEKDEHVEKKKKKYKSTWWVSEMYILVDGGMYLNKCPILMCLAKKKKKKLKGEKRNKLWNQINIYDLVWTPSWVFLRTVPGSQYATYGFTRQTASHSKGEKSSCGKY